MSEDFRNPLLAAALWMTAILYFGVQWMGASTIVRNKIFVSSRNADRAEFASMVSVMSENAQRTCGAHVPRKLLFADGDIVVPYLQTVHDTFGGCEIAREIVITPFSKSELEDCNTVFIREFSPSYPYGLAVDPRRRGVSDARVEGIPWTEIERWTSNSGIFGFAMYGHPCTGGKS